MKVIKETKQPLLSRMKYEIELGHAKEKTPSKKDLIEKIYSNLKKDKELTVLDKIYTKVGSPLSKLIVYVYDTKEDLDKSKPKKKDGKKKSKEQNTK